MRRLLRLLAEPSAAVRPLHLLQSLKTLCTGTGEVSDADLEQLEAGLKESILKREPGIVRLPTFLFCFTTKLVWLFLCNGLVEDLRNVSQCP